MYQSRKIEAAHRWWPRSLGAAMHACMQTGSHADLSERLLCCADALHLRLMQSMMDQTHRYQPWRLHRCRYARTHLLRLPVLVTQRAHRARLQPALDAVRVEHMRA